MTDKICESCIHYQKLINALTDKPQICVDCTNKKTRKGYTKHKNWEWEERGQDNA